jgi:hypothetical protein
MLRAAASDDLWTLCVKLTGSYASSGRMYPEIAPLSTERNSDHRDLRNPMCNPRWQDQWREFSSNVASGVQNEKKALGAFVGGVSLVVMGPIAAHAQDFGYGYEPPSNYNWSGLYFGGELGASGPISTEAL